MLRVPMMAQNCLGRSVPWTSRRKGRSRLPSPPARITPHRAPLVISYPFLLMPASRPASAAGRGSRSRTRPTLFGVVLGLPQDVEEIVQVEGLQQEVIGAPGEGLFVGPRIAKGRDQDDRGVGDQNPEAAQDLEAASIGQVLVQYHAPERPLADTPQGLGPVCGLVHQEPLTPEELRQEAAHLRVILHDQDSTRALPILHRGSLDACNRSGCRPHPPLRVPTDSSPVSMSAGSTAVPPFVWVRSPLSAGEGQGPCHRERLARESWNPRDAAEFLAFEGGRPEAGTPGTMDPLSAVQAGISLATGFFRGWRKSGWGQTVRPPDGQTRWDVPGR